MNCRCKKLCYFLISLVIIGLLVLGAIWRINTSLTPEKIQKKLNTIDQDPAHWIGNQPDKLLISPEDQARMAQSFIHLYFSVWQNDELSNQINSKILKKIQSDMDNKSHPQSYQFTYQPYTAAELEKINSNIDLTEYPQINRAAIITHVTPLVIFPTLLPNYNDPKEAGEGYPFNNWLATYLFPGMPVKVLQRSKDQLWYLIKTSSNYGWVQLDNLAFVDPKFIAEWQKHPFVVTGKDGAAPGLRKGVLYPTVGGDSNTVNLLFPYRDENGNARLATFPANKREVFNFPIPATARNIAEMAKTFINEPYGWGNLYELRDCSSTTEDILAGFGVWLPRNSTQQFSIGTKVPLPDTNIRKKRKIILTQGVPFLSLVHLPGHITLYIGSQNGDPYVEQEVWAIHTTDLLGRSGRAVIGKTVISSLELGKNSSNVTRLQMEKADSLNIYNNPESYADEQEILKKVWKF